MSPPRAGPGLVIVVVNFGRSDVSAVGRAFPLKSWIRGRKGLFIATRLICLTALTIGVDPLVLGQSAAQQSGGLGSIHGVVRDVSNHPVAAASVVLERKDFPARFEVSTTAEGVFFFPGIHGGSYSLSATKPGVGSGTARIPFLRQGEQKSIDLTLGRSEADRSADRSETSPNPSEGMQLSDQPNFTVAGVTDWTAVGGHGSDSTLRTSEALARETAALQTDAPGHLTPVPSAAGRNDAEAKLRAALAESPHSFGPNHELGEYYCRLGRYREAIPLLQASYEIEPGSYGNEFALALALKGSGDLAAARDHVQKMLARESNGDLHRLLGEIDEGTGDPLAAVHEEEQAVRLDPSEANYFAWGSELLLHRAVQPAQSVFRAGAAAYPKSARMATALGAALFAGALYEESALRLCEATELNPSDPAPYVFLGKIAMAAPMPLACVEPKLARFVQEQPGNALASYYYAMAILKRQGTPANEQDMKEVETLLNKAVTLDPRSGDAYLQLGILRFGKNDLEQAIGFYRKAIEADPQLGEAHYRLGVAYKKTGEQEKAKREFQLHDDIEKRQADLVEQQRREVRQFLVVLQKQPGQDLAH
ncbi:MAG TPA: tetratricopeptide repeat protein [Acidisarcina sp.]